MLSENSESVNPFIQTDTENGSSELDPSPNPNVAVGSLVSNGPEYSVANLPLKTLVADALIIDLNISVLAVRSSDCLW